MPRVWEEKGYKFYIYLNESKYEPPHIHVLGNEGEMKIWLNEQLEVAECYDIPLHEWGKIIKVIKSKKQEFITKYHELNQQSRK